MKTLIHGEGLRKTYKTDGAESEALASVDIIINEGEMLAITGESGSGKSTMLSVLGAVTPATSGSLMVDEIDISALGTERSSDFRREYVGFVFQQFHLVQYLTALENVMLPLAITKRTRGEMRQMALRSLERVGLGSKAGRLPSELSGGEQQRVAVARAIVNDPPIILADEPTGNLDTRNGEEVFSLMKELHSAGKTLIIVTHNHELAGRCPRVIGMKDGKVVSDEQRG